MKVYVEQTKECIECDILRENKHTVWIKLPNGDEVKRYLTRNITDDGMIKINKLNKSEVSYETAPISDSSDDGGSTEEG